MSLFIQYYLKRLLVIGGLILGAVPTYSSMRFCDSSDADFLALGAKYPAVGYFSCEENGIFGSGSLIKTNIPELERRVVLSAAHVLTCDGVARQNITFHLVGQKSAGTSFVPVQYEGYYQNYQASLSVYDIGLFLLNEPIDAPLAEIDLDTPFKDFIDHDLITVGFGTTGQHGGAYLIHDIRRRGSYAHALPWLNKLEAETNEITHRVTERSNVIREIKATVTYPVGAQINLTPLTHVQAPFLPEGMLIKLSAGCSNAGDSGGGVFSEDGKLIAILIQAPLLDHYIKKRRVTTRSLYMSCKERADQAIEEFTQKYHDILAQGGEPDFHLPLIIADDGIDVLEEPRERVCYDKPHQVYTTAAMVRFIKYG